MDIRDLMRADAPTDVTRREAINCLGGCYQEKLMGCGDNFENIYLHWQTFGWHRVAFVGDFVKEAEMLAERIGFRIVYEG